MAVPFCIPTSNWWVFLLLHILPNIWCCQCFGFCQIQKSPWICHSNRCAVVSCCFNLHFPDDIWCGDSFHMLICHLYFFFGEMSVKIFVPFFNEIVFLLLNFKNSLYILDKSFIRCVFGKYFLPVCGLSSNSHQFIFNNIIKTCEPTTQILEH